MTGLQIFKNSQFGEIRTIEENSKVLFCGSDVAKALGYVDTPKAIKQHCKEDGWAFYPVSYPSGTKQAKFINEGNLYRLIVNSKLPTAEKFERWVFDEVLPSIRKTGGYVSNDDMFINTYLPFADDQTKLLFKGTLQTVKALNHKIETDKPKVLFANAVETSKTSILIGDLAKILKQNNVDIGQKRLFEWLRDKGYLMKTGESRNMPTQKSMEMGLFEIKKTTINNADGSIRTTQTAKATGKGQVYFVNKFINNTIS